MDMAQPVAAPRTGPTFGWWLVLALVGLDYFSTLAYLPSIAVEAAGPMAPLAAAGVVAVTFLFALPVYSYVVGRSAAGYGATGLLDRHVRGWTGKLLLLVLLGFVATDFVITRTLSVADASTHILANRLWKTQADQVAGNRESLRKALPAVLQGSFFEFWNEQIVLTVGLSLLCFALLAYLRRGFTANFLRLGAVVVAIYLLLSGLVIGSCLFDLLRRPQVIAAWWDQVTSGGLVSAGSAAEFVASVAVLTVIWFPQMALGLSGFELSMASAPLVRGDADDDPDRPRGRIRRTRMLMVAAALVMGAYMTTSVFAVTLLVPEHQMRVGRVVRHRALAFLAHGADGQRLADGRSAEEISPLFGETFGTIYDLSTVAILCLAGASTAFGMRDVVPHYLARYGMQLDWARRSGFILHSFNLVVLVVTVLFRASVSAQQWAYATSVLALLAGAAVAAALDVGARWQRSWLKPFVAAPFGLAALFFLVTGALTTFINRSGLAIALAFVLVTLATAFFSRWLRSTELRFAGFTFADQRSEARWKEICGLDFQVLVPYRPGLIPLETKEHEIRTTHRIAPDVPVIFVEVSRGDPSDFMQAPLLQVVQETGREIVRVSHCASVAHVLAAMGLAFREVGKPPEIHFGWSNETPLAANLSFLLLGEGNIPWMVQALIHRAEPDPARRPRVVIG
jgi:hypothetical protein